MSEKMIKTVTGTVEKISGKKTIKVKVENRLKHKKLFKIVTVVKNYLAHDEKEECKVGNVVTIKAVRPLSKRKNWIVIKREE